MRYLPCLDGGHSGSSSVVVELNLDLFSINIGEDGLANRPFRGDTCQVITVPQQESLLPAAGRSSNISSAASSARSSRVTVVKSGGSS